jgi:hypothetical protein
MGSNVCQNGHIRKCNKLSTSTAAQEETMQNNLVNGCLGGHSRHAAIGTNQSILIVDILPKSGQSSQFLWRQPLDLLLQIYKHFKCTSGGRIAIE